MATWQLQEAKAKLSEVIETARKKGPQVITQRGVETAVILPFAEWQASKAFPQSADHITEQQKRDEFLKFLRSSPDFEIQDRHRERIARRKADK